MRITNPLSKETYIGPIHNNNKHGSGSLVHQDRQNRVLHKYKGGFFAGQYQGEGVMRDLFGRTISGIWNKGVLSWAHIKYASKDEYEYNKPHSDKNKTCCHIL